MKTKTFATLGLLVLALSPTVRAADTRATGPAAAASASPMAKGARVRPGTTLGSRAEEQRYAAREAASPDAKNYKGGNVIVISTTTAVVILLIILIIVLI